MNFILNEDDAIFTIDSPVIFPHGVESATSASEQLKNELSDWDITDKTDIFKSWVKKVEGEIVQAKFNISVIDIPEYEMEFITDVLGFHPHSSEVHYNLADFGIELKFKTGIDNTSDVIPPMLNSSSRDRKFNKHIVHVTMDPVILLGWSKLYIKKIARTIIEQLLMDGVSADTINNSIDHLWLFEHLDPADELKKQFRRMYLALKYARGHKDLPTAKNIKDKLSKWLNDVEWELVWRHEGDNQKIITKGIGLTQNLADIIAENDIEINSFKITDTDI